MKAFEHHMKQYFIFVDLRKAYDSVPRVALWTTLKKLGVPYLLVDIIRSFHQHGGQDKSGWRAFGGDASE